MAPVGALLWRRLRVYQVYGANTDVGKTVFTTILCRGARNWYPSELAGYLKPVATGPLEETDAACEWSPGRTAVLRNSIFSC